MNDTYTELVQCRITKDQSKMIDEILLENPDIFDNRAHFLRAGIVKLIIDYKLKKEVRSLWKKNTRVKPVRK